MNRGLGHKRPLLKRPERAADLTTKSTPPPASRPAERVAVRDHLPGVPGVVAITGTASNAGKTWLAERVLEAAGRRGVPTTALKVTRTHVDTCPRENDGCGVCDDLTAPFEFIEDPAVLGARGKDTGRYVEAGATLVRWLLVQPTDVPKALVRILPRLPADHVVVAEGNSFRDYGDADVTVMAVTDRYEIKPSARAILDRVDLFVPGPDLTIDEARTWLGDPALTADWVLPEEAGEAVLERLALGS